MSEKNKMEEMILCVRKKILFPNSLFQGFKPNSAIINDRLKTFSYWARRGDIENDPSIKHLIGYVMIANLKEKTVFVYQRSSKTEENPETRLHEKWSCGIGGHIEQSDKGVKETISLGTRELQEEIEPLDNYKTRLLGYINDDNDDVGKVHFGLVYLLETNKTEIKPISNEIACGGLKPLKELERMISLPEEYTVENWAKISARVLIDIFKGKKV